MAILGAPGFLSIFQPHVSGSHYTPEIIRKMLEAIVDTSKDFISRDPYNSSIIFCFEAGAEKSSYKLGFHQFKSNVEGFLKGQPSDITSSGLFDVYESVNDYYLVGETEMYLDFRDLINKTYKRKIVTGLLEWEPLHMFNFSKFKKKMIATDREPLSDTEQLEMLAKLSGYIVQRDVRYALNLVKSREQYQNPLNIIIRGTAHLGLIHPLQYFSNEQYPHVDYNQPVAVNVQRPTGIVLPILWNQQFWNEVLSENGITSQTANYDRTLQQLSRNVAAKLQKQPYRDYLFTKIAKYPEGENYVDITLTQDMV